MTLALEDEAGGELARSEAGFDVLWALDSWSADARDFYEVTATTLLPADSVSGFREQPMGQRERWVERLWRAADPTPETGENESREEFRRRVHYANARYSTFQRGMYNDRGRVYIRYGEPDDVKIERVPASTKTLGYALQGQIPPASQKQVTDTQSGVADMRAYEIWTYDMRGDELVRRYAANEQSAGLRFVFVDVQGYGEYILEYSSTSGIH
jgi:GWxTD domain-containing protein